MIFEGDELVGRVQCRKHHIFQQGRSNLAQAGQVMVAWLCGRVILDEPRAVIDEPCVLVFSLLIQSHIWGLFPVRAHGGEAVLVLAVAGSKESIDAMFVAQVLFNAVRFNDDRRHMSAGAVRSSRHDEYCNDIRREPVCRYWEKEDGVLRYPDCPVLRKPLFHQVQRLK